MSASDLSLANVINISVSVAPAGLGSYNNSNIGLFTHETPDSTFGTDDYKIYKSPSEVVTDFGSSSVTAAMANAIFGQKPNILAGGGYLVIMPFETDETLDEAIVRTQDLVQYFGILSDEILSEPDLLGAAAVVETLNKIMFVVSKDVTAVDTGGSLDLLRSGSFHQSRGLMYVGEGEDLDTLKFGAAYAGRALSTDFSGSNTTQTMHLKDLVGIQPDVGMTQTLLTKSIAAGVDTYVSLQGLPKVFCTGANHFFDQVYNLAWLVGALQVAGFNALAQASTKLPQTEDGLGVLKAAYRTVCEAAKSNQYAAPGTWTSGDTFGNLADFVRNIGERGYYIYSAPIASQLAADREDRKAPLIQIAIKEAGAVHSSNVLIFVNA